MIVLLTCPFVSTYQLSHIIFFLECAIFSLKLYSQDDWTAHFTIEMSGKYFIFLLLESSTRFTVYIKQIKSWSNLGGVIATWWVEMLGIFLQFLSYPEEGFCLSVVSDNWLLWIKLTWGLPRWKPVDIVIHSLIKHLERRAVADDKGISLDQNFRFQTHKVTGFRWSFISLLIVRGSNTGEEDWVSDFEFAFSYALPWH